MERQRARKRVGQRKRRIVVRVRTTVSYSSDFGYSFVIQTFGSTAFLGSSSPLHPWLPPGIGGRVRRGAGQSEVGVGVGRMGRGGQRGRAGL